jgi:hypothetical protein
LGPPTDATVLANFYRRTRPFGLWKPLEGVLDPTAFRQMKREHRNDLIALPFAFAWMVSMYLLPMQLLIQQWQSAAVTAAVFAISLVGLYQFWYKSLPQVSHTDLTAPLNHTSPAPQE